MAVRKSFLAGDLLVMKKPHACDKNANRLLVLTLGSDIKVRCASCGHEVVVPRIKLEKNIKSVLSKGDSE